MSGNVVQLRKSHLEEAFDLISKHNTQEVLFIFRNPETEMVEYITPCDMSIYELSGWCQAVSHDLMGE